MSDPQKDIAARTSRWRFLHQVYRRRVVLVVLIIYNGLQLVSNLIAWTTSPEIQQKYQFIKLAQVWSLRTWIIGLLLILLVITFEGALSVIRTHERFSGDQISKNEVELKALREQLKPKLAILFEPTFPFLHTDRSNGFDEIRIGVQNISARELSRVRVQLDDVLLGATVYNSLPLHVTRTKRLYEYPYQTEFSLNSGDIEYLDLAMSLPDRSWASFNYSGDAPDQIEKGKTYEFIITATASEGKPFRKRAILTPDMSPPFTLLLGDDVPSS